MGAQAKFAFNPLPSLSIIHLYPIASKSLLHMFHYPVSLFSFPRLHIGGFFVDFRVYVT